MQSFASPFPQLPHQSPHPTKITHHKSNTTNLCPTHTKRAQLSLIPTPFLPKNPQKGRNYRLYLRPFCQKTIERAQLSLILTPFLPKNHRKGATIAYTYALSTQKTIERAQLSPMPQEKFVNICANSWLKTTNTDSTNHTDFLLNPCNNFNHKLAQIILRRIL